jgi:hypothetical protein
MIMIVFLPRGSKQNGVSVLIGNRSHTCKYDTIQGCWQASDVIIRSNERFPFLYTIAFESFNSLSSVLDFAAGDYESTINLPAFFPKWNGAHCKGEV